MEQKQKYRVARDFKTIENGEPVYNYRAQMTILPGRAGRWVGLKDNEEQWETIATYDNGADACMHIDLHSKKETKIQEIVYEFVVEEPTK